MHETILHSNWDTMLVGVPFIIMLLVGFFRLDELFATPKDRTRPTRAASGVDRDGQVIFSDPDGRRWNSPSLRK